MYNPISNMWKASQSTSAPESCFGALSFKGAVLLVTGSWNQESSNNLLLRVYDVDMNQWKTCAHFPLIFYPHAIGSSTDPKSNFKHL